MRILIVTQVVDRNDSYLGFFVRWIEAFAKQVEHVEVICLKKGTYTLPNNVSVHSLGKERGVSRLTYVWNFYRSIWRLRHEYDAVFVHMNPEYIVLGGLFWRLWHKKLALWYMHKSTPLSLRIALLFVERVFTGSQESFRITSDKVRVVGHGIDLSVFFPLTQVAREQTMLSVGRLSPSKRHDLVIRAAEHLPHAVWIVGEGPERAALEALTTELSLTSRVHFLGPKTQAELPDLYRRAGVFVHTSETGSLDKVVLEALACGLPVITTSTTLSALPVRVVAETPDAIAQAVATTSYADTEKLFVAVRNHHSLEHLIPTLVNDLKLL